MEESSISPVHLILDTARTQAKHSKIGTKKRFYPMWFGQYVVFNLTSSSPDSIPFLELPMVTIPLRQY